MDSAQLRQILANGPLTIDEILIGIYRDSGNVIKRVTLASRLNYYTYRGGIRRVSPGTYSLLE